MSNTVDNNDQTAPTGIGEPTPPKAEVHRDATLNPRAFCEEAVALKKRWGHR